MTIQERFWDLLKETFCGIKVESKSGFANLYNLRCSYFERIREQLSAEIELKKGLFSEEELYQKLYDFLGFLNSGVRIHISNQDVSFFWKTDMFYYVKSEKEPKRKAVDYFIYKDAKKSLQERLGFWFSQLTANEFEGLSETKLKQYQTVKQVADKLVNLIAEFEDKIRCIWEKPRFVFNSNYVITLDRIADKEGGYEVIRALLSDQGMANQIAEWKELGIVDENFNPEDVLDGGHLSERYKHLPIDTKHFKHLELSILSLFDHLDKALDGWLIKSENWQALNTILPKFKERVQVIYIDPPFNTGNDFLYKDTFRNSIWLTLIKERIDFAKSFLRKTGAFYLHLDENANYYGRILLQNLGFDNIQEIVFNTNATKDEEADLFGYKSFGNRFVLKHNTIFYCFNNGCFFTKLWKPNRNTTKLEIGWLDLISKPKVDNPKKIEDYDFFIEKYNNQGKLELVKINVNEKVFPIGDLWNDIYSFTQSEMRVSENISFLTQKPENLIRRIIQTSSELTDLIMDYFAGSGTTLAVAHKLGRKWIGIEMADYFNEFFIEKGTKKLGLVGRLKIVLHGDKNFKAVDKRRRSHLSKDINWQGGGFFKYYELEQFEDILKRIESIEQLETNYQKPDKKVDLPETLSNLLGMWIKKIGKDFVELEDDSGNVKRIDLHKNIVV